MASSRSIPLAIVSAAVECAEAIGIDFQTGHRVDLRRAATALGIDSIEPKVMNAEGCLCVENGKVIVRYNASSPYARRRFTVAHEIGHVILAQLQGKNIKSPMYRSEFNDSEEETIVNRVAAALLMPQRQIKDVLAGPHATWTLIQSICTKFDVSRTAVLRRILELDDFPALAVEIRGPTEQVGVKCYCSTHPNLLFPDAPHRMFFGMKDLIDQGRELYFQVFAGRNKVVLEGAATATRCFGRQARWLIAWMRS